MPQCRLVLQSGPSVTLCFVEFVQDCIMSSWLCLSNVWHRQCGSLSDLLLLPSMFRWNVSFWVIRQLSVSCVLDHWQGAVALTKAQTSKEWWDFLSKQVTEDQPRQSETTSAATRAVRRAAVIFYCCRGFLFIFVSGLDSFLNINNCTNLNQWYLTG